MAKVGRPPVYKKDFHPRVFVELSKQGKCLAQIAADWDMARETLHRWAHKHSEFGHALKKGRELCEGWYIDVGQRALFGQMTLKDKTGLPYKVSVNLGFYCWMTKNIFKWSDNVKVDAKTELSAPEDKKQEVGKLVDWLKTLDKV